MQKYCYYAIGINKDLEGQFTWYTQLFADIKLKEGFGQLAICQLKGNWNSSTYEKALKEAKDVLKALGVRHNKSKK